MGRLASPGGRGRVALALVLTIGPTLALGYFGYRSVVDREQSLRVTYTTTGVLVRDRLSTELAALEDSVMRDASTLPTRDDIPALQTRLRAMAKEQPWLVDPFVAGTEGEVITEHLWSGLPALARAPRPTGAAAASLAEAEAAEFGRQDLGDALRHYRRALASTNSPEARAFVLSRIGRTQFKLNQLDDGLATYRTILTFANDTVDVHGLPYPVIALSQIHDGLEAASRTTERTRAALGLQRYIVEHPWDVANGYGYYLRRAHQLNAAPDHALLQALSLRLRALATMDWISQNVRPLLGASGTERDMAQRRLTAIREDVGVVIGIHRLPPTDSGDGPSALGFTIRTDYVAGPILDSVIAGVELGQDTRVVLTLDTAGGPEQPLAASSLGEQLPGWGVAIVDARGRTIEQLTARERWAYGGLVGGALAVLVAGLIFTTRAWAREAELSKMRTDFVSNVSHELKTPLALIRMFGETLESGLVEDPAKRREFYGIIRRESERLTHLINNVLDTAKIEAGTKQFTLVRGDLVALVTSALDAYAPLFKRLDFDVEATLPHLMDDGWQCHDVSAPGQTAATPLSFRRRAVNPGLWPPGSVTGRSKR